MNKLNQLILPKNNQFWPWINGVMFSFIIAALGYGLACIPGFQLVGKMACAMLIAISYRQIIGYPEGVHDGIQFCSKTLLRFSIVLYGLQLDMNVVLNEGLALLALDAAIIISTIFGTLLIAKWLKAETSLSTLLAIGTAVCGAAAIAAVSSILKSKEEDTALSIGMIAIIGSIFAVGYSMLRPFLSIESIRYGIWSGVSLHELAHVVLAAAPAGQDALAIALLAKMGRVFLLAPLCFILLFWMSKKNRTMENSKIAFPWFLVGFIITSMIGSYVFGPLIPVSDTFTQATTQSATFMLTMAMAGLGLNVNLRDARTKAVRPMLALICASLLLSIGGFFIIL